MNVGRLDEALEMHEQQLSIAKEFGYKIAEGFAYGNLGNTYLAKKDQNNAVKNFLISLDIAKSTNDYISQATALRHIGYLYWKSHKYLTGEKYLLRALSMSQKVGDVEGEQRATMNLALLRQSQVTVDKGVDLGDRVEGLLGAGAKTELMDLYLKSLQAGHIDTAMQLLVAMAEADKTSRADPV